MYLAKYMFGKIQEVSVVSETGSFVLLEGEKRKDKKQTDYSCFHETYEAAKEDILARLKAKRHSHYEQIARIDSEIEKAEQL